MYIHNNINFYIFKRLNNFYYHKLLGFLFQFDFSSIFLFYRELKITNPTPITINTIPETK